jgi:hypothetical protein
MELGTRTKASGFILACGRMPKAVATIPEALVARTILLSRPKGIAVRHILMAMIAPSDHFEPFPAEIVKHKVTGTDLVSAGYCGTLF